MLTELNAAERTALEALALQPGVPGVSAALALRAFDGRVAQEPLPAEEPSVRLASVDPEETLWQGADSVRLNAPLSGMAAPPYRLYPNPAGNQLMVEGGRGQESWQLLDASGTPWAAGVLGLQGYIPLVNLPPGLYALRIINGHEEAGYTLPFIKAP
jgi:hypothetical protein